MLTWRAIDPEKLQPQFRDDVEALLTDSPYDWTVTYGFRSEAEQADLYAKYTAYLAGTGPKAGKAAPPGKSAHEFGLAIDVALDGSPAPGLQPDWVISHEGWAWLFDAVFAHPRLHSGRDFDDADHIEAVNWKAFIPR